MAEDEPPAWPGLHKTARSREATRYDKFAGNFLSAVAIAKLVLFRLRLRLDPRANSDLRTGALDCRPPDR